MKLATWNVNSLTVRLPQVLDWLAANPVDVLVLQETKCTDDKFPHDAFAQAQYHSVCHGQKTYNGVALISKQAPSCVQRNNPHFADEQARIISALVEDVLVVGAYFPNGQAPESDKFAYKMRWLDGLHNWMKQALQTQPKLALMGDFNIAPQDRDSYDPEGLRDTIHHTKEERKHFQNLLDLGFCDTFRLFEDGPKHYSWWDYRNLALRRNQGLRIDHILLSPALRGQAQSCTIDKIPRKNERPSDHAPVIVQI